MRQDNLCGLSFWHPKWLQRFATTKYFMGVYGLLGTVQAMSYMYFIVTLTTLERRFKIPSQTTGIILSGNEISQILLSLILSYAGGQRNRPRWIAWGIVFCGISCFILALPHFIYGAGDDLNQLTQEYLDETNSHNSSEMLLLTVNNSTMNVKSPQNLCDGKKTSEECDEIVSMVPLVLIFLSQFVLGIGNTLYYSLGQTYLDDNTKKTNTPMMLAFAMSLRMIGPIVGFFLGFASLNMFIDARKTPLIDKNDPRWLGAWWFGWIILGSFMLLFSGLIGVFPKELPKKKEKKFHSEAPKALMGENFEESFVLGRSYTSNNALDKVAVADTSQFPELKDFPKALMRLLKNKLLMFNIVAGIFYILGAAGYMTFLTKYMEVQFHKNSQNATIVVGPLTILGMVAGFMISGLIISIRKPKPSKVLFWNVIVGGIYISGQISYLFLYCGHTDTFMQNGRLNVTTSCNQDCACDRVSYSPVCETSTETTYFSACHAGCKTWNSEERTYSDCHCNNSNKTVSPSIKFLVPNMNPTKAADSLYFTQTTESNEFSELDEEYLNKRRKREVMAPEKIVDAEYLPTEYFTTKSILTTISSSVADTNFFSPGACLQGCAINFYMFSIISMLTNSFGSSGRIGNVLVNYRSVSTQDKSFAQGLALMLVSLFALIPGPIIFGRIIDSSCLIWTEKCGTTGNCQLYNQTRFRYLVNASAIVLTILGVFFDILVWYYGRNLDLYGENEQKRLKEIKRKNQVISPLLQVRNET